MKNLSLKLGLSFFALLVSVQVASAADLEFSADTTLAIDTPAVNLTILSGSKATSLSTDGTATFNVTVPANDTFAVRTPAGFTFTSTAGFRETCDTAGTRTLTILDTSVVNTSITIAATTNACVSASSSSSSGGGGAVSGGGGGGSSSSADVRSPSTSPSTFPYVQLPEKNSKVSQTVVDKDVKFPSTGRVTKKTMLRDTQSNSSYLLSYSARVKTVAGKLFTGLVNSPKEVAQSNLPTKKMPKGVKFLRAVEVSYSEAVKINEKFQIKIGLPEDVTTNKSKDKKRFKMYVWSGKTWILVPGATLSNDGVGVYAKTQKYGIFLLVDTKK